MSKYDKSIMKLSKKEIAQLLFMEQSLHAKLKMQIDKYKINRSNE